MEEYPSFESEFRTSNGGCRYDPEFEVTLLEPRPFRPFKSSEEYLYAMKEDLAEWLNGLYDGLNLTAENFLEQMETGVVLCRHANNVVRKAREFYRVVGGTIEVPIPDRDVVYRTDVLPETFHARDNVSNFISWCRALNIKECLLFETDDLVLRKNERSFILCLLEVARRGAKFGMPAPLLVQLEQEIDAELANDDGLDQHHQVAQVVTNDLRSLHQRVVALLSRCTCPSQFPMIRVADGKYRIGDTKVLIFVRILRSHVMVRVGGGWDTLEHYLDKHDPCRCRSGHRLATSAKLTMYQGKSSIPSMHVTYNRPPQPPCSSPTSPMNHRRSLAYTSAQHRSSTGDSPPGFPIIHPPQSDDSSASNPSLHDNDPRCVKPTVKGQRKAKNSPSRNHFPESTSEDVSDEDEDEVDNLPRKWEIRSPSLRRKREKGEFLKDTVPSSWQYTPGYNLSPTSTLNNQRTVTSSTKKSGSIPRLPTLSNRCKNQQPQVVKVSPRVQNGSKWSEHKSQSSEDLYQNGHSGPVHKNLVFHSRGTSPVNLKGRQSLGSTVLFDTSKPRSINENFRRGDPIRHSSYHSRTNYAKVSPSTIPPRPLPVQENRRARKFSPTLNGGKTQTIERIETVTSPVLIKLLQHNDLCSDLTFLKKIEMLITEYERKSKKRNSSDNNFEKNEPRSLPVDLENQLNLHVRQRKSPPRSQDRKLPSKIPLPRWQ